MIVSTTKNKAFSYTFKKVRENINLNKLENNTTINENLNWTDTWLEQTSEFKTECIVNPSSLKNIKFIIKWWEN
ncbi:MAG: hypothetical protein V4565_09705 [Bacteroidota bacterium]